MTPPDIRSPDAPRPGFTIGAVVLDLDGTVLDDKPSLHPRTRAAVRRAAQRVPVVIATGRMYRSAQPWAKELGVDTPLVCYQGAIVREYAGDGSLGELLFACELDPAPALKTLAVARNHNWHVNAYQNDELICDQDRREAHLYAQIAGMPIHFVPDLEPVLERGSTKLVCVIEDDDEKRRCVDLMRQALGDSARVTWSLPMFVEIVDPRVSKARAVNLTLERLGAELAGSIAIGDAPNDLEMLNAAGFAVAVRSAPAEVIDHVSASCEGPAAAGVADVLEALLPS
ncbi:MAG TPA: HAD family hydrolase [Candidatus Dormibacteraeota bacterium]|nr:HAD family hydrolase [Candidatus Dormibacteraeota bacterium]